MWRCPLGVFRCWSPPPSGSHSHPFGEITTERRGCPSSSILSSSPVSRQVDGEKAILTQWLLGKEQNRRDKVPPPALKLTTNFIASWNYGLRSDYTPDGRRSDWTPLRSKLRHVCSAAKPAALVELLTARLSRVSRKFASLMPLRGSSLSSSQVRTGPKGCKCLDTLSQNVTSPHIFVLGCHCTPVCRVN